MAVTIECKDCGVKEVTSVPAGIQAATKGCPTCGEKVKFNFPEGKQNPNK